MGDKWLTRKLVVVFYKRYITDYVINNMLSLPYRERERERERESRKRERETQYIVRVLILLNV